MPNQPSNIFLECKLLNEGYTKIIGIDEVGRGCWAGPVYVGAMEFDSSTLGSVIDGVKDSKLLSPKKREEIYSSILKNNYKFDVFKAEVARIDALGINNTIKELILSIKAKFKDDKVCFLIDGRFDIDFGSHTFQIVKGDTKHYSISCASIVAKVERDRLMANLSSQYDKWDFQTNKGYGTSKHIDLINKFGICELHRQSYKPIQHYISKGQIS